VSWARETTGTGVGFQLEVEEREPVLEKRFETWSVC
jgi:hypothetical protein